MTKRTPYGLVAAFLFVAAGAVALEIPLKQSFGEGAGTSIAYVDMETIFQQFPETAKAKEQYYQQVADRRETLAQKEKELVDLREQLSVLRSTLEASQSAPSTEQAVSESTAVTVSGLNVSTASLAAVAQSLTQREQLLQEKEASLKREQLQAVEELKRLEEQRTLQIYGKLYNALVQLAEEQGVSLIVDKTSILYGQKALDLTDRLSRRVRGLPDTDTELQNP
jgi:Skp family chaperone for outer membrane proteins